jgi:TonB family protein
LRLLSNFETSHAKLLHIVLAGQPELGRKLSLPALEQLRQRITIVSRLDVFAPADVIRYVAHRLKRAGYRGDALFTPEALGIIVEKSHGVPREINRLCFNAMSIGCALGKILIDGQMVREAAADLEFGPQPNQEERVQGRRISGTADELAALFTTALQTPAPAKEKAEHITLQQELPQAESASPVAIKSERQPQTVAEPVPAPVPEQPKAERGELASKIAKPSFVSAWLSGVLGVIAAFRVSVRNAFGQIAEKMLNWRVKRAAVPSHARQSQRLGFRRFAWPRSSIVAAKLVFGRLIGAAVAFQVGVCNILRRFAQKKSLSASRAAAPPTRAWRWREFRGLAWGWGLTAVVASLFGGLVWLSNHHGDTAFAAHFVSATQRFASDAQKSAKQWLTPLKSAFASETEKVDHSNTAQLVSRPQESAGQLPSRLEPVFVSKKDEDHSRTNSSIEGDLGASLTPPEFKTTSVVAEADTGARATDTAPSTTPAADSGIRNPKTLKATGLPKEPAAPTGNNVHKTQYRVSFAGTPTMNHFATAAATPPAPEITIAPKLITRVDPIYPQPARNNGISGGVVLNAHIDESGKVQKVQTISGDPALVPAAVDAVRQWGYQPSLVNGQPRQSDMRIVINFSLR